MRTDLFEMCWDPELIPLFTLCDAILKSMDKVRDKTQFEKITDV